MYVNGIDGLWRRLENPPESAIKRFGNNQWSGAPLSWFLGGMKSGDIWPVGFFPVEHWGAWAESEQASLVLPVAISGMLQVSLGAMSVGKNIGREVTVRIGDSIQTLILDGSLKTYLLDFEIEKPAKQIFFDGYVVDTEIDLRGQSDSRALGIGISSISIKLKAKHSFPLTQRVKKKIIKNQDGNPGEINSELPHLPSVSVTMNLEISGLIYLMEFRAIDLMFDNWREIAKNYSLALENQRDTHLLIACPYNLMKFIIPLATEFFDRIQPISTPVHFMFSDRMDSLLESLVARANLILIRRADGMECNYYLELNKGRRVTIGPSADAADSEMSEPTYPIKLRRQLRPIMHEETLPVVFTSTYDNGELYKTFQKTFQCYLDPCSPDKFQYKNAEDAQTISKVQYFLSQIEKISE